MKTLTVALAGNPNCGKTTIFNALTGSRQHVGNWPGVTVEKKIGAFEWQQHSICVVDLPGVYSLNIDASQGAIDEKIACDYLLSNHANVIVNIIDASNLERNLYLTTQLLELQIPVIIALNMTDVAEQKGLSIDCEKLAKTLGCPVVPLVANKKQNIELLKKTIAEYAETTVTTPIKIHYPAAVEEIIATLSSQLNTVSAQPRFLSLKILENGLQNIQLPLPPTIMADLQSYVAALQQQNDFDIVIADSRYQFANHTAHAVTTKQRVRNHRLTQLVDRVALNRYLGVPIFLGLMYLMFLFAINIGGAFQDFFDIGSQAIFVQGLAQLLTNLHAPSWFTAIFAVGIGKGINTTITFTPIIAAMFFFLAFLEDSGYMARAAFVMDRLMRAMGLPGKSFVPLIVGFGCNVPAIMATRTLENQRDRILTVMMSPFISCGARLAIFAIFTAAFFPTAGQDIVFALYLIGIIAAVLTGFLLRKTILQGEPAPLVMELPPYHLPNFKTLCLNAWHRLKSFLLRAGKLIVPICVLIGALNAITINGTLNLEDGSTNSLLSVIGRELTPIFAPIGIHQDNWPATVGLFTGVLAKEVVIATLNTLYTQVGHLTQTLSEFNFWQSMHAAVMSIPENIKGLGSAFSNPIMANAKVQTVNDGVFGVMYQSFGSHAAAFAYLLFVLLYIPCVSTIAAIARELGKTWALFSLLWNTVSAYSVAVVFYQAATLLQHPMSSSLWIIGNIIFYILLFFGLRYCNKILLKPGLSGVILNAR